MKHYFDTFPTPLGDFSVALDESGSVVATAFGDATQLRNRFNTEALIRDPKRAAAARREITEFFTGGRKSFKIKLSPEGTAFQKRVWSALLDIPYGKTKSYGQLAEELGTPGGARAVGRANATNPICLLVPCHRVIGADGSLTGFAFGTEIKRLLLDHESTAR